MFYTYILYSEKLERYYIGSTEDVSHRLLWHNEKGDGYTSKGRPWVLKYSESYPTRRDAELRERQLKKWKSSKRISALIARSESGSGVLPT